jgi:hypothetical protein
MNDNVLYMIHPRTTKSTKMFGRRRGGQVCALSPWIRTVAPLKRRGRLRVKWKEVTPPRRPDVMTLPDVTKYLHCGRVTVYRFRPGGELPGRSRICRLGCARWRSEKPGALA